jgi:2-hydroxycyclohexanecarboxyl-CoA dehydrogenase
VRGLEGQSVLLTGGARGIGRAIAERLCQEGVMVGVLDLSEEGAAECAEAIEQRGGRVKAYAADITDAEAVESTVAAFAAEAGSITGLVNNAGWDSAGNFVDTEPELWRKLIEINLMGPLNVTRSVLLRMREQGAGRVVSIASDAGRVGSSGESVYAACKGGVIAFSKSVARELAREGITLNVVSPGPTETQLFADFDASGKLAPALARAIPMRRLGQPSDLPGAVAFLLSDDASFITGQTISVSGGLTMHG